jgi:WD40 repeat protein
MVFSFDGLQIALCYRRDYSICLWHTHSRLALLAPMQGHIDNVRSVMFSPDGKRLVSGSEDATVRVWDTTSGTEVYTLEGHKGTIHSVTFCPDGSRIVSGSADKTVRLWNATSGTPILVGFRVRASPRFRRRFRTRFSNEILGEVNRGKLNRY